MQRGHEERGFSAWHLVLIFLVAVAVCGVFFSLGYVVGVNHAPARASSTETEMVTPGGNVPPTVNPPAESAESSSSSAMTTETVPPTPSEAPPVIHPKPLAPPAPKAEAPARHAPVKTSPAPAHTERKKPARTEKASKPAASPNGHYAVQVVASKSRSDANTVVQLLKARRYSAFMVPHSGTSQDGLFRVRVGPFASHAQAESALRRLEKEGFKPFIIH